MTLRKIVNPSDQTQAFLPQFVGENYQTFVNFMAKAAEAQERQGFGQDLLQNLQRYRDFDTYAKGVVESGTLAAGVTLDEEDEIVLEDGVGFPLNNGVILIGDEVILYRTRSGNTLQTLERAASATTVLPSVTSAGKYSSSVAAEHKVGTEVTNISGLFLSAILTNIHDSFTPGIHANKVNADVDRSILLQNIKDFYGSKGTKLSVKALFKFIFGDTEVEVRYPGDLVIRPSGSSYQEFLTAVAKPLPYSLLGAYKAPFDSKKLLGSQIVFRTFDSDVKRGSAVIEYATQTNTVDGVVYSLYVDSDSFRGRPNSNKIETATTVLKRNLLYFGSTSTIATDITTITVDSTNEFPESGILFIGDEGIRYTSKSNNQFFGCTRAAMGHGSPHSVGSVVYGAEYADITTADGETTSCWLGGLYRSVDVANDGLLAKQDDTFTIGDPGDTEFREITLSTLQENTNASLVTMATTTNITDVTNVTSGISAVYYNDKFTIAESSGLPSYQMGPYSTDGSVGPDLKDDSSSVHLIPRKVGGVSGTKTGSGRIGMFVDGTPALSMRNGNKIVSGILTGLTVVNGGINYGTATAVFEPSGAAADVTVEGGVVTSLSITSNTKYTEIPTVRITEGEGALFDLTFDQFGRLTDVVIVSGGQFYFDVPVLFLDDASGRGTGAVLACSVSTLGQIDTVTIVNPGLDYVSASTTLTTLTSGSGAEVTAQVETYNFNRVEVVSNSATELSDVGNGIIASLNEGEPKDTFGIPQAPEQLLTVFGDDGATHSALIGWAYDGNPIYGPTGFLNGVDDSEGVVRVASGYSLQVDRSTVIPEGSTTPGAEPPDILTYPMGTFVEDYLYDPDNVAIVGNLQTELDEDMLTDPNSDQLRYQFDIGSGILDEFNGRVCNTPEFPASEYPDGVYCYFVTKFGSNGTFPYIVGPTFKNKPVTQNVTVLHKGEEILSSYDGQANYSEERVTLRQRDMKRLRNSSIPTSTLSPTLEYSSVLSGGVDGVAVIQGSPDNATVRDQLYFDNTDTDGTGASAVIQELEGETITSASGESIVTRLLSHTQRINLEDTEGSDDFVFPLGSTISTTQGSSATVIGWSYDTKYLDVNTTTERLIRFGDSFEDSTGDVITIEASRYPSNSLMSSDVAGGRSTHASWEEPDRTTASPGDLWWSAKTGRLYVFYQDADSSQWVTTQPSGSRSFYDSALDVPVGDSSSATQSFASPQADTAVTISTMAPSERADGTPNGSGDLWWSTHTGMLYIWAVETSTDADTGSLKTNAQWVATDPSAAVMNDGDQSGEVSQLGNTPANPTSYTQGVEVLISEASPATLPNGTALVPGTLWWSPASGKMYIYYVDVDTSQWVVTNPTTVQTGPSALDKLIVNDGSGPDFISLLPVPATTTDLWFEKNQYFEDFEVGDTIEIRYGTPGSDLVDTATITEQRTEEGRYFVKRSNTPIELTHGAQVTNLSKAHYRVTTDVDHNLQVGDMVRMADSGGIDGTHNVYRIGSISEASFTAVVNAGVVTSVTIDEPGEGYDDNFYLSFSGGEGLGAQAVAFTDGVEGITKTVSILDGGSGYSDSFGINTTSTTTGGGSGLIVDIVTTAGAITGVTVTAPGTGYTFSEIIDIPGGTGGQLEVTATTSIPEGQVHSISVLSGGGGYTSVPNVVHTPGLKTNEFLLLVDQNYGTAPAEVSYDTSSPTVEGTPSKIRMLSNGTGYTDLPRVVGLTRSQDKAANVEPILTGTSISGFTVFKPGFGYTNPIAIIEDITGAGSGATASVTIDENGSVTNLGVISAGENYVEPFVFIVENTGEFIATTNTIGRVKSVAVTDPGSIHHVDSISYVEPKPPLRVVIHYPGAEFIEGEVVFQGDTSDRKFTATVESYNTNNHVLTLVNQDGNLVNSEGLTGESNNTATILNADAPEFRLISSAFTNPMGRFVDNTGSPSDIESVIHDSLYYQNFSYVISSTKQREEYENIVAATTHPAGMIMFGELRIDSKVQVSPSAEQAIIG